MNASLPERLSCHDVDACLHPFVDGELEPDDRVGLDEHLLSCVRCSTAVSELRAYKRRLRGCSCDDAACRPAPSALRASLVVSLNRETTLRRRRALRPYVIWPVSAVAAAACVLFVLFEIRERERTDDLVAAAIENHTRHLPLEVLDTPLPTIRTWFADKVAFAPNRIPQLGTEPPLGARLSHLRERDAAYVVFSAPNQRRVSLFVIDAPELMLSPDRRVADRDVMLANQRGYNVAIWKDQEIVYSLVSDLDERDILEMIAASKR